MPQLHSQLGSQLRAIPHDVNLYIQAFVWIRDWALPETAPGTFRTVISEKQRPAWKHVRTYNRPEATEIVSIISEAEDGSVGRCHTVLRCRSTLNRVVNEVLDEVSVIYRSYDPLIYVLSLSLHDDGLHIQIFWRLFRRTIKIQH